MAAMIFKTSQISQFLRSHGDAENTYSPRYGESFPVAILMKIDIAKRAILFFGMVVKTVKNGLSFAAKRGSKHNNGT